MYAYAYVITYCFFVSKKQFNGVGCSFTPSFKGSPSLFVTVGLSPFTFCFFAFLLVADLSSTLSDDSCIAVSPSLTLAHVSSFPWTSVQLFLRSVSVLPCASSCLHSCCQMALTLDLAYWMPCLASSYGRLLVLYFIHCRYLSVCRLDAFRLFIFISKVDLTVHFPVQR